MVSISYFIRRPFIDTLGTPASTRAIVESMFQATYLWVDSRSQGSTAGRVSASLKMLFANRRTAEAGIRPSATLSAASPFWLTRRLKVLSNHREPPGPVRAEEICMGREETTSSNHKRTSRKWLSGEMQQWQSHVNVR